MRHSSLLALVVVCAGACLAKEYSITKSFDEDRGDDGMSGGPPSGGRGGIGGSVSPPGGEGGDDPGTGGSTGGSTSGSAGEETGGTSQGGGGGDAATGGGAEGGKAQGGRGGSGGGSGGASGSGTGGRSGGAGGGMGKGGMGGAAGTGTSGSGGMPACSGACIVHRYAFNGTGTTATDSVGTAHGTIVGGAQTGGSVTLAGGATDQYVSLPAGVLAGLADVTLEFWVTWTGGTANWQRVFDFGSNDGAPGEQGTTNTSSSYFFFTTRAQASSASAGCTTATASLPRVAFTLAGVASETCVFGTGAFPATMTQVAVTIQGTTLSLYMNGTAAGTPATLPDTLAAVTRTNNWLGRSQYVSDAEFAGSIHEFRVYGVARSPSELAASNAAGPDAPPTQ